MEASIAGDAAPEQLPARLTSLHEALESPRIAGLDFLRAVAVLLVLADHSGLYRIGPVAVFDGGFGVEMFFVLSGFLITWLLLNEVRSSGDIRLGAFYRRRAARLLPAFYAYLLVGLAILVAFHKPVPWGAIVASAFYVINYYQAFTGAASHYLSHCWSLAVEEQFYLLWPLLLLFAVRNHWRLTTLLVVVVIAGWLLRTLLVLGLGARDEYVYRALDTRSDQLAVGCLLAVLLRKPYWRALFEKLAKRRWVGVLAITAIIASLSLLRGSMELKYVWGYALEPVLVAILIPLTILAANGRGWTARLLTMPMMVMIGQVSYGVYLIHPFVIHPAKHLFERWTGTLLLSVLLSIAVVVIVAYASFTFFENPLRRRLRGRATPSPATS